MCRFDVLRALRLIDLNALKDVFIQSSRFDVEHRTRLRHADFLAHVSSWIARPVLPSNQGEEYLLTQAVAEYLAYELDPSFDGIIYPSSQHGEGENVVLFHGAARVESRLPSAGARVEVELTRMTEDGSEPDYSVIEWLNHPDGPTIVEDGEPYDERAVTLRLDRGSLEVLTIDKVTYATTPYPVFQSAIESARKFA